MRITYIITVNPIIELQYLNALILSLNLQSDRRFDVVFYNQIDQPGESLLQKLLVKPEFDYRFFDVPKEMFFNHYPVWDLYGCHQELLDRDLLGDYFMSLHMEEFLDIDYTANAIKVLEENRFDILLGNLTRTPYHYNDIADIADVNSPEAFNAFLLDHDFHKARHWCFATRSLIFTRDRRKLVKNLKLWNAFGRSRMVKPSNSGYFRIPRYLAEDVYFMKTSFARRTDWFKSPTALFFSDIHISYRLDDELKRITDFPVYFNASKVYHLQHRHYFYHIENDGFVDEFMQFQTEEPILLALQKSLKRRKEQKLSVMQTRFLFRGKMDQEGHQDINFRFHSENISRALQGELPV